MENKLNQINQLQLLEECDKPLQVKLIESIITYISEKTDFINNNLTSTVYANSPAVSPTENN